MRLATSFLSEHSVELILVPKIIHILKQQGYEKVIPIFFWASREGGIHARESINDKHFRILALFPRRPKVEYSGAPDIYVNLNEMLFAQSLEFKKLGIPVIAGLPLISNLLEFQTDLSCLWLKIHPDGCETQIKINLSDPAFSSSSVSVVNEIDFRDFILNDCRNIIGKELIDIMRAAKDGFSLERHRLFGEIYKPCYLLIPD